MFRSLAQSLSCLLCSIFCLLLVSGPALAGDQPRTYVASHFALELAGDIASQIQQISEDPALAKIIGAKEDQKAVRALMGNPVSKNLVMVGDVRAKAPAKKKKVPGFASIDGAKERTLGELLAWAEESHTVMEMMQESLEDKLDSRGGMSEENLAKLQLAMQHQNAILDMISNLMKKLHDQEQEIIDNMKA